MYTNDTPVVLCIDGQMIPPDGEVDASTNHPAVANGTLAKVSEPKAQPKKSRTSTPKEND